MPRARAGPRARDSAPQLRRRRRRDPGHPTALPSPGGIRGARAGSRSRAQRVRHAAARCRAAHPTPPARPRGWPDTCALSRCRLPSPAGRQRLQGIHVALAVAAVPFTGRACRDRHDPRDQSDLFVLSQRRLAESGGAGCLVDAEQRHALQHGTLQAVEVKRWWSRSVDLNPLFFPRRVSEDAVQSSPPPHADHTSTRRRLSLRLGRRKDLSARFEPRRHAERRATGV